ncbi:MAG TPA: ATPase domain-containing protein [Tepidisphaeraceae bacterium]|jgi:circadian clock protein KaiC
MDRERLTSKPELPGNAPSATGTAGLDQILGGGFTRNRLYLIEGDPGAGKTTLALCYLLQGAKQGERGMYVTLSETREEINAVAESHGWSLDPIHVVELVASEENLTPDSQYTMYHPSETELGETTRAVLEQVERFKPTRVVFDSLSELRLLAQNPLRYRRQILALKQFFAGRNCTVLLLDDRTSEESDLQVRSIAHGVLTLEQLSPEYGAERRRLRVVKMRGKAYKGGYHDFTIVRGGLDVFPRLVAADHHQAFARDQVTSGVGPLDRLLGGGLDRGTSTLIMGPAGSGKSSVAVQYACAAAARGERAALFAFDESRGTLLTRSAAMGMDLQSQIDAGRIVVQQIDPAELSPGEFVHAVRRQVETCDCRLVIIDSLNGYMNAMPEEKFLSIQLHELLTYLGQKGVTTILVVAQHGLVGGTMQSPVDVSYLADSVILTRYFEYKGRVKKAISVVKKRSGSHEETIRELRLDTGGIRVGEPLEALHGVLTGVPRFDRDAGAQGPERQ